MKHQKTNSQTENSYGDKVDVGGDVTSSIIVTGDGNVINVGENKQTSVSTNKRPHQRKAKQTQSFILKILGAIVVIAAVIISSSILKTRISKIPAPSATTTSTIELPVPPPTVVEATILPATDLPAGAEQVSSSDGMRIVYVPSGLFIMGAENGEPDELPVHDVYLDSFWIDQTEVTNAMYKLCVDARKCSSPFSEEFFGKIKYSDYPVVYVSWNDAKNYCDWAGRRLPTEAEWEKAARGADGRAYPWGNGIDCKKANYGSCFGSMRIVGVYTNSPSPYGALDMVGNAWEWVSDWYGEFYYANSPHQNPQGPAHGEYRSLRGGSWESNSNSVRSAKRSYGGVEYSNYKIGFRCAKTP